MPREPFLLTLRELARCYQAFELFSAAHVRELGLTLPQFDIIATLGNTPGMTFKELGEKTLITKGTLTGVVDRLEEKGLVQRVASETDRRSVIVRLTAAGERTFRDAFPAHAAYLKTAFDRLTPNQLAQTVQVLGRLRAAFENAQQGGNDKKP
ncbi:MAG: MarR family transcriptional regulator [Pseudomonadota bacterium]